MLPCHLTDLASHVCQCTFGGSMRLRPISDRRSARPRGQTQKFREGANSVRRRADSIGLRKTWAGEVGGAIRIRFITRNDLHSHFCEKPRFSLGGADRTASATDSSGGKTASFESSGLVHCPREIRSTKAREAWAGHAHGLATWEQQDRRPDRRRADCSGDVYGYQVREGNCVAPERN